MNGEEFLHTLWGDQPPGIIQIWQLQGRKSSYIKLPNNASGFAGAADVYTAVGLAHKDHGRYRRCPADKIIAIAGLWLDIDVDGGPENKTDGVPNIDAAIELAHAISEPTLLVTSGYGIHAWHLFEEPWRFRTQDEQDAAALAEAQWCLLHRNAATERGWRFDVSTRDLARLMRLPGTVNAKGGLAATVEVLEHRGGRYSREQLLELAATAGPVEVEQLRLPDSGALPDIVVRAGAQPPMLKLDALRANSEQFADTWDHRRRDAAAWSLSEYDLSIASQAAAANFTDQELADLIGYHRSRWDSTDTKAQRPDYVRRTIAKARESATRSDAATRLRQLAEQGRDAA